MRSADTIFGVVAGGVSLSGSHASDDRRYKAVAFDLLTALLDSWAFWNDVAGSAEQGFIWRSRYLMLTYEAGRYQPYEGIIRQAALDVGLPVDDARELLRRWDEIRPWPETRRVLHVLAARVPIAVVTNCSNGLANISVACLGVTVPHVVTAEAAGWYKPAPRPYLMALEALDLSPEQVLFVAGSAADVPGAVGVGMDVFWHNRFARVDQRASSTLEYESASLLELLDLV